MTARKPGPQPTAPGFITIIIIDPTLGSVVLLRQIVFTTSRGTTPRVKRSYTLKRNSTTSPSFMM